MVTQPVQDCYGEAGRGAQEGGGQSFWRGRLVWYLRESPDASLPDTITVPWWEGRALRFQYD